MNGNQNKRRSILICAALAIAVFLVYFPVRQFDFVAYDDGDYIYENPEVQAGLNWESIRWAFTTRLIGNWHPVTWLSHMLDCQLFGLNSGAHHLVNVLIHAAASVLLFLLLKRMTNATWRSAFVAALFALHPLRVESVAWVSERKDVLSGLFWILSTWMYVRYAELKKLAPQAKGDIRKFYLFALFFFAVGLMSKPMLVTLPFALLLLDFWPLHRVGGEPKVEDQKKGKRPASSVPQHSTLNFQLIWPLVREKIPFFILSMAMNVVTYYVQGKAFESPNNAPPLVALANVTVFYQQYIRKMFWPSDLACIYPAVKSFPTGTVLISALLLISISALALWRVRKQPYLLVGWLWFLGVFVPVVGFVQIGAHSITDRYTYLPEIGIALILAWGIPDLLSRWRNRHIFLGLGAAAVLILCVGLTYRQVGYWRNTEILFTRALEVAPENPVAYNNRGYHMVTEGRDAEAMRDFQAALKIKPRDTAALANLGALLAKQGKTNEAVQLFNQAIDAIPTHAAANNSVGLLLVAAGRLDEAIECFSKALVSQPNFFEAHHNLADALVKKGEFARAAAHYERSIRIKPSFAKSYNNYGLLFANHGSFQPAAEYYQKALAQDPKFKEAHNNLGIALGNLGKLDEAIVHFKKALELNPNDASTQNNLGNVFALQGKLPEAVECYSSALKIRPDYVNAHNNLGMALARQGKWSEAIEHYNEMIRLNPKDGGAYSNLGDVFSKQGKTGEAIQYFRKALEIEPDHAQALRRLAWVLSTQKDPQFRNGAEAVQLAEKAANLTGENDPEVLDTLAAAYAEVGRFPYALKTAQRAVDLAESAGQKEMVANIRARLQLYQSTQPYHQ